MNNMLYDNILYSIGKEIKNAIDEQFTINDLDLSDGPAEYDAVIFNKKLVDPKKIYDKLINNNIVDIGDIKYLNSFVAEVKIKDDMILYKIISYYSTHCYTDSLNWLDVSEITNMSELFYGVRYNGDISKWDVSNVTDMSGMFGCEGFGHNIFNHDISGWDVSSV